MMMTFLPQQIIRWNDQGDVIIIEQPELLVEKVIQAVYKQKHFASFSRQLNVGVSLTMS